MSQVRLRDGTGDGWIYGEIFERGDYDALKQCKFSGAPAILDLGAHIGLFALWCNMQWPECKVHCVEPVRDNIDLLMENCKDMNFYVRQAAIAAQGHRRAWLTNEGNHSFSFITTHVESSGSGAGIQCLTVREVILSALGGFGFDIIKIDIEGAEDAAFQSFGEWNKYAHYLAVECHRKWMPDAMSIDDLHKVIGAHRNFRIMEGGSDSLAFVELLP